MKESAKYKVLQGVYWMLYCVGFGYVTYFLQEKAVSVSMIGIVTAICGVISAFLQTWVGRLADRGNGLNWKSVLTVLIGLNLVVTIAMGIFSKGVPVVVLFGAFLILINCMMPLVNAACFYYQKNQIAIDFGTSRAVGSLAFAVISVIIGKLTTVFGAPTIVAMGVGLNVFMLLSVMTLPYLGDLVAAPEAGAAHAKAKGNFVTKYPAFLVMVLGLSLVMSFHNCIQTYMLMILQNVGGGSDNLGVAIGIASVMELLLLFKFSAIQKRFGTKPLLLACGIFYCIRGVLYLFAVSVWQIYLIQMLQAVTFAIYASASTYYSDEVMADEDKVTGQALMAAVLTIGGVIGNLQGGFTYDALGIRMMLLISLAIAAAGTVLIFVSNRMKNKTVA